MKRVWLITGISRGIGRAIGEAVLDHGDLLVGTVRAERDAVDLVTTHGAQLKVVVADVSDAAAVRAAAATAVETFGRIDVLVNNAGYTLLAGIEEATDADIQDQFATNAFGVFNATRAVLPAMRAQQGGRVIVMSSVAGVSASPGLGYYAASKHAVEGFAEALSKEVRPHGIKVTIVQPGLFRTNTLGSSMREAAGQDAYADTVGKARAALKSIDGAQPGDPRQLAAAILRLADEAEPPLHLPLDPGATTAIRPRLESQLREMDEWAGVVATPTLG
ncbi:SDR family NAD(P)-dependent oxidoreductase [Mycolicibacterium sp. P9-22]|uniref:SDR family NAD(P)-dependent oxidoreductase n=1 Tax=Mycolicibacterium sp. P9-22 TaxID=2024613 RepID=UPI0011EF2240|nr:SDR family NAD(P)-dependent oxidoreductase [Mycolicibacterium sp. P9-22]KAA0120608.1 SDR family NAD(P)-dependent oxidoreductase [Mycolicibacterium sp. P9-22]